MEEDVDTHEGHIEIQDEVEEEEVHHHPHHLQVKDHLEDNDHDVNQLGYICHALARRCTWLLKQAGNREACGLESQCTQLLVTMTPRE